MSVKEQKQEASKGFSKGAALGVAAAGLAGMALARNAQAAKVDQIPEEYIEADVLVIGGGIAATWAALKARESGAKVVLVDKGTVGRSGKSPWFGITCYYDPEGEFTKDEWIKTSLVGTEYISRLDYFKYFFENTKDCWEEMDKWGVNDSSKIGHAGLFRGVLLEAGVEIHERIMITDLVKKNGEAVGAAGFPVDEDKLVVFNAKAVINCAGAGTFKGPGYAVGPVTFDAHMMGYRAGCEIAGKEWGDFHTQKTVEPTTMWGMDFGQGLQLATEPSGHPPAIAAISAHAGTVPTPRSMNKDGDGDDDAAGGPPSGGGDSDSRPSGGGDSDSRPSGGPPSGEGDSDSRPSGGPPSGEGDSDSRPSGGGGGGSDSRPSFEGDYTMAGTTGMSEHHLDGIFPADDQFNCGIPGFYAAGDALATAGSGLLGSGSAVSSSHGAGAGKIVGEYVKGRKLVKVSSSDLKSVKDRIFAARKTEQGFSPRWVQQVMQNTMLPYYVLLVKEEKRMQAALNNIVFLRKQFVSQLLASDAHELRLAHEVDNMTLNAEMKLRAALLRTESRHNHYREDIPARDDKNWLAWVIIKQVDGEMEVSKRMMPEDWLLYTETPYEERYSVRFPNELEFKKSHNW
jgi:succinate dehydrogenase/fumarate reductase flavoprotein subunit